MPSLAYGLMYFGQKFPGDRTPRAILAVSTGAMYRELLRPRFSVSGVFACCSLRLDRAGPEPMDSRDSHQHWRECRGILVLVWINRADGDGAHVRQA